VHDLRESRGGSERRSDFMNKLTVIAASIMVFAAGCAHQAPVRLENERDRLNQRQEEFFAAQAARDAARTAALFSAGAVLHVANMPPVEGRSAIERFYGNMFGFLTGSTPTPERMEIGAGGEMAYVLGSVRNEFRSPQGTSEHEGKYSMVWRKLEGEWMIVFYGVSSNQAPASR
jgi:ketosteroid isomerase-like protein